MKKILVPTDYSDLSEYALNLANTVAEHTDALIYVLKVVSAPGEALFDENGILIDSGSFDVSALEAEKEENLSHINTWADKSNLPVHAAVRIGHLQDQILHFIDKEQIDLVVMGTHGASGIKELIAGSVAERLVKDASIPVLTLKCDRSDINMEDIILASHFEHIGPGKLDVIKKLQKAFGATLHLLKVNTPKDFVNSRDLLRQMQDFVAENGLEDTDFSVYCANDVAEGITNFAEDQGIDLIALATHGRSTLSRVVKKSISKKLVNHVSHPILTFGV